MFRWNTPLVPPANSAKNTDIAYVIGNKSDDENGSSLYSKAVDNGLKLDTIDGLQDVPSQNSAANLQSRDVIGNKTDTHDGNSLYAFGHTMDEHIHKASKVYPTLAGGKTVTAAAGAWTLGNFSEIVPINTITDDFDIHFVSIESFTANDVYELVLYATTTEIARVRFARTAVQSPTLNTRIQTPIIDANTQIQAKIACAGGTSRAITMSIFYHTY